MQLQACLKKLIAADKAEQALHLLQAHISEDYPDTLTSLSLLSARIKRLKEQQINGTVYRHDLDIESNRINASLQDLVSTLPEAIATLSVDCPSATLKKSWWTFVPVVLALAATYGLLTPYSGFNVRLSVLTDHLTFQVEQGNDFCFSKQQMSAVMVQGFQWAEIPAETLHLDANYVAPARIIQLEERLLVIRPRATDLEPVLTLAPASLECIRGVWGGMVTLTMRKEEEQQLQIELSGTEAIIETLIKDATTLDAGHTILKADTLLLESPAVFGHLSVAAEGQARIKTSALSSIIISGDSIGMDIEGFEISQLAFHKPGDGGFPISSVKAATIDVQGSPAYELMSGEDLLLKPSGTLLMKSLTIDRQGIRIQVEGKLDKLRIGNQAKNINPRGYEILWNNYRPVLVIILSFAAVFLLGMRLRLPIFKK